jgi:hypothetical protein
VRRKNMAIKKHETKTYDYDINLVKDALRMPRFAELIDAEYIEEAITQNGTEFRYVRKSTSARYGRNFFINVATDAEGKTAVTATIQSRKVTVLLDNTWKLESDRAYASLETLVELIESKK